MNETYATKTGLRVIYIEKPSFHQSYAGIGVNYGSRDLEYTLLDKKMKSPAGTAHFLEHKLFQMPDGDAFSMFSKQNAHANAYTDLEKTIYYLTTSEPIYASLKLLLEMFFTPYFKDADVEREKGIIHSEIRMQEDMDTIHLDIMNVLYQNSSLAKAVVGSIDSVSSITAKDLQNAYDAFYTSDNSFLVVISNQPRAEVYDFIEKTLANLVIKRGLPIREKEDFVLGSNLIKEGHSEQTNASLAIRLDANHSNTFFCEYIIGLLDCFFSPMASFYKELHQEGAFFADIEYTVMTLRDTSFLILSTTSNRPKLFLRKAKAKLKSLKKEDIDLKIIELYLKHLKAKAIRMLDSVEVLGEEVLTLALEDQSYLDELEKSQKIKPREFYSYIDTIKNGNYIEAIIKKSKK